MKKTILFTGGGSAGHVTPNLALIKKFQAENWQVFYVGSHNGIEKEIISKIDIPYYSISTGKLRRYFSWQNFIDPFKVMTGFFQAYSICRKLKPAVVFSKGGFVSLPVVLAAWLNKIPVVAHESDLTPGLTTRLCVPFVNTICLTFPESEKYFKDKKKILITGTPVRSELLNGDAKKGREFCHFSADKKIILVIGGGLGAKKINETIRFLLPQLLEKYQIVHLCGKGKLSQDFQNKNGYMQFEYLHEELPDVMAPADFIISRAGANSLYELLALKKPHILIPLPTAGSRGDQIDNANYFACLGLSQVISEEELTPEKLLTKIEWMNQYEQEIVLALQKFQLPDSIQLIYQKIGEILCMS